MINKKFFYLSLPLFILILLAFFPSFSTYTELKLSAYSDSVYAVRIDGQGFVYGKIKSTSAGWIKLRDVYYFQTLEVNENETSNLIPQSSNILTAPDNFLLINRSKIISLEKVGESSKLLEIMNQNKK